MAYNLPRQITENNPSDTRQMHLPPHVIQQLNAAKGGHLQNFIASYSQRSAV
ncbi:hypothetical protein EYZ11_007954 [Aspergillus tanneri]|uniref:Uncharacterized protein n=1 Tax=Aspergillus tanneri TaxID=1220188 RepID=A0A4S3JBQ3_9EURO|nr:uncharacterized protein ATNIH1004_005179 [Aspergillus tanneri]KAA8649278.1 hypothetical protein ATNIH1004_005179 [Aspergillus tanneri]THC92566.1 hypothetical protein EYZ11_007954 [Aspergillus tanneri]